MACKLEISELKAPVDRPLAIHVSGLQPNRHHLLRLSCSDQAGKAFNSWAVFRSSDRGTIDPDKNAPLTGSYAGVDPMGLFWSMMPLDIKKGLFDSNGVQSYNLKLAVETGGKVLGEADLLRTVYDPARQVIRRVVEAQGLVGTLYVPPGKGPHPAVLVLGGSQGGLREAPGALLAGRGYAALVLAYFNAPGLPDALMEIPLEYFMKALDWLVAQPEIDPARIAPCGWSKGGELALLLAANFPGRFRAVAALSPSSHVWQAPAAEGRPPQKGSWSRDGLDLPWLPFGALGLVDTFRFLTRRPAALVGMHRAGLKKAAARPQSRITIEQFRGPVLLASGTEDALWPSSQMCRLVVETLKKNNHPAPFEHLECAGAGHGFRIPYLPDCAYSVRGKLLYGGTPEANARAAREGWEKLAQFLGANL
jgi:dienelactone hydrolase